MNLVSICSRESPVRKRRETRSKPRASLSTLLTLQPRASSRMIAARIAMCSISANGDEPGRPPRQRAVPPYSRPPCKASTASRTCDSKPARKSRRSNRLDNMFALVKPMQSADVLLQSASPRDRHCQEQLVQPCVVKAFANVAPSRDDHTEPGNVGQ